MYITLNEASKKYCEKYGVSKYDLREWLKADRIKHRKTEGNHFRIVEEDLITFLENGEGGK